MSYVNSERYLKDDQFTPMNCEEVLRSILEEWTAVMIQSDGEQTTFAAMLKAEQIRRRTFIRSAWTVTADLVGKPPETPRTLPRSSRW